MSLTHFTPPYMQWASIVYKVVWAIASFSVLLSVWTVALAVLSFLPFALQDQGGDWTLGYFYPYYASGFACLSVLECLLVVSSSLIFVKYSIDAFGISGTHWLREVLLKQGGTQRHVHLLKGHPFLSLPLLALVPAPGHLAPLTVRTMFDSKKNKLWPQQPHSRHLMRLAMR